MAALGRVLLIVFSMSLSISAYADLGIDITGFATVGFTKSDIDNDYVSLINKDFDFNHNTRAGLNFYKNLSSSTSTRVQIIGRGTEEGFKTKINLAQFEWNSQSGLTIRAGQLRLPLYIISDFNDIGEAYLWNVPPIEVYGFSALDNYLGVSLLYNKRFGDLAVDFELLGGGGDGTFESRDVTSEVEAHDLLGVNVKLATPMLELRFGAIRVGNITLEAETVSDGTTPVASNTFQRSLLVTKLNIAKGLFTNTGLRLNINRFFVLAERAVVFSDSAALVRFEAYYGTVGVSLLDSRWTPHLTFSELVEANGSMFATNGQHTLTFGNRYQLNDSVAIKLDLSRVETNFDNSNTGFFDSAPNRASYIVGGSVNVVF